MSPTIRNGGDGHGHKENGDSHGHGHDHSHDHQSEVEVLSVSLRGSEGAFVDAPKLMKLLEAAPKDEIYRIKSVLTTSSSVEVYNSDQTASVLTTPSDPSPSTRYILNWAFGRWTFTPMEKAINEHESSDGTPLRMTMILARYESAKWKKKLEVGGLLELDGNELGELTVTKIA
ncbi:hypothetical protein NUW58_g8123 [Xylaria curta]|uniref:Uncharacterized protein n=1 Tax=Xylaria curta TaxID=42375 RepID=A0ACC1NAJ4_9PEZI|nr:hypothetical protein NUW58_g8123 [Xylaria curta]